MQRCQVSRLFFVRKYQARSFSIISKMIIDDEPSKAYLVSIPTSARDARFPFSSISLHLLDQFLDQARCRILYAYDEHAQ